MSIEICKELSQNAIDFAYEANSQRAFADARDGLKPGQRACLWEMYSKGYASNKPHVKSAKISGGVIGSWWPHGDVAIYETFARMSQPWINNIPEVDWHGANGNQIMGNAVASSRYTEARLSKATEEGMLKGIKKNVVNMILNFSEDEEWPEVLPAIFPRLAINGCQGIGYTIANTWLPMNLREVSFAINEYVRTGKIPYNKLAPDFPTGGTIINSKDLHKIYETGKGKAVIRAKATISKNSILITELPYQIFAEPLLDEIKKLIVAEEITGIKEIFNKSDKKRLLIEVECDGNPGSVLNQLYNKTSLQKSYSANQYALVGKTPRLLTMKDYVDIYISHNSSCIRREYEFDLKKATDKLEIAEGLLKALEDIDNIITLIKKSESSAKAKDALIVKYNFTDRQAKAIIDMRLGKLAHLEAVEIEEERKSLVAEIENINSILSSEASILDILLERLNEFTRKYGVARKTELTNIDLSPEAAPVADPVEVVVIMMNDGTVKRIPKKSFKVQHRNGKGIKNTDSAVLDSIATTTIDNLLIFTDKGKMFKLLVDNIPEGTNASRGAPIQTLVKMEADEKPMAIAALNMNNMADYVVFFTKNGLVKKTEMSEYTSTKRSTGIQAIKIKPGDSLVGVSFVNDEDLILVTHEGYFIRFISRDIAPIGRATSGVKGIKLGEGDYIIAGMPIKYLDKELAVFSVDGHAKRIPLGELGPQGRGGRGFKICNEKVADSFMLNEADTVFIMGAPNSICIQAAEIPCLSRTGTGNQVIKNSKIISCVRL